MSQRARDGLTQGKRAEMARRIKVYVSGRNGLQTREVSLEEAKTILQETYADSLGGLVADRKTGQVIWEIGPNVQELYIIEHMVGGG
jgi:hypothetical protein